MEHDEDLNLTHGSKLSDDLYVLSQVADNLYVIADAFYTTGNETMFDVLQENLFLIRKAVRRIKDRDIEESHLRYCKATEQMGSILQAFIK
jgi:hypothetical protein